MTPLAVAAENVGAGPLGLLVTVLLGIALVLLIRNMNRRLRRMPREFPPGEQRDERRDPPVPPQR